MRAKHPLSRFRFGSATAIGLFVLNSLPCAAQTAPTTGPSSERCANISLTAEGFANAYYDIASHGDLLDVAFIERTLQTQFRSRGVTENGTLNPQRKHYMTDAILGVPIAVTLDVKEDPTQPRGRSGGGMLRFDFARIVDCLPISLRTVSQRFNAQFLEVPILHSLKDSSTGANLSGIGGSTVHIGFSYRRADKVIIGAAIDQSPSR